MTVHKMNYDGFIGAWVAWGDPPIRYETVPPGIEGWEINTGSTGAPSFTPPHLERVTMFIERDGERIEHCLFERGRGRNL